MNGLARRRVRRPFLTGNQLKAARALVLLDQGALAKEAGVNVSMIRNMEGYGSTRIYTHRDSLQLVKAVLESHGVEFLDGPWIGVRVPAKPMPRFLQKGRRSRRAAAEKRCARNLFAETDALVCTENSVRIDLATESPNVIGDGHAVLLLTGAVRLAVQVEEPT
jgi:hypothetical protein